MKTLDLRLYSIIDPAACVGGSFEDTAVAAVKGGATCLQYRDKGSDLRAVKDRLARVYRAVRSVSFGEGCVPFLVNDHVHLAAELGVDGVHIGQGDVSAAQARHVLGPDAVIGLTAFTPDHMAAVDPEVVSYVGTGPVYPTQTDKGKPILGIEGLADLVALSPVPVVAIGGITADCIAEIMRRAAPAGVAVMRGISAAADPEGAARQMIDIIQN